MAKTIQVANFLTTTQDFTLGNKTHTATFTPETDEKFNGLLFKQQDQEQEIQDLYNGVIGADDTVEERTQRATELQRGIYDDATAYIKEVFAPESADEIIKALGGRWMNATRLVGQILKASAGEVETTNREQRRNKG